MRLGAKKPFSNNVRTLNYPNADGECFASFRRRETAMALYAATREMPSELHKGSMEIAPLCNFSVPIPQVLPHNFAVGHKNMTIRVVELSVGKYKSGHSIC
jgi:hypothetical protein